jgi:hypothetical protein
MATLANLCIGNSSTRVNRGGTTEGTLGFGYQALQSTNGGNTKNMAFGTALIASNLSSCYNTAIGHLAGCGNTSGQQNTSVGHYAGRAITTPYQNSAFGWKALCAHTTGCRQIAIGAAAMANSTTGNSSIGIGVNTDTYNATNSIAIGSGAIASQNQSIAIGNNANVSGDNSVAIGAATTVSGGQSVAIGYRARAYGYCSIAIGYNTRTLYYNQISIGSNFYNTCFAGTIIMGNTYHNVCNCIYVDWTYCSDRNEKTNIQSLPYNFGLPFIKKLRPVKFNWDIREKYVEKCGFEFGQKDGTLAQEKENYGLIAQELEQVLQELNLRFDGLTKNDKRYRLASTNLLAPLVKSIQQLSVKLEAIKKRLTTLENN